MGKVVLYRKKRAFPKKRFIEKLQQLGFDG
jgi:hypothetical protein